MAEGDGLLNRYTESNPYPGFESPPLRSCDPEGPFDGLCAARILRHSTVRTCIGKEDEPILIKWVALVLFPLRRPAQKSVPLCYTEVGRSIFRPRSQLSRRSGYSFDFDVVRSQSLAMLDDDVLSSFDLLVPIWTFGELSDGRAGSIVQRGQRGIGRGRMARIRQRVSRLPGTQASCSADSSLHIRAAILFPMTYIFMATIRLSTAWKISPSLLNSITC